jgi:hypothetical protein
VRLIRTAIVLALLTGCGAGPRIDTVEKLAGALKREGLAWETMGELDRDRALPKRAIQEGFELAGDGLLVEVYRVEDETFFKTVAAALAMRAGMEPVESQNALVDVCVYRPFALAVVEEPEEHSVRRALARVFQDD